MKALIQEARIHMKLKTTTVEQGPSGLRIMPQRRKKNKKGLPEAIKCKVYVLPCPRVPKVFMCPQLPAYHKVQKYFLMPLKKVKSFA